MSYLTASEYNTYTGRSVSEALDRRLTMASKLLDTRIGVYSRQTSGDYEGYKLDLDDLFAYQVEAVKTWVAWMVAALYLNNDSPGTFQQIKLGRFSVSEEKSQSDLPDTVLWADYQLKDANLINRRIKSRPYKIDNDLSTSRSDI